MKCFPFICTLNIFKVISKCFPLNMYFKHFSKYKKSNYWLSNYCVFSKMQKANINVYSASKVWIFHLNNVYCSLLQSFQIISGKLCADADEEMSCWFFSWSNYVILIDWLYSVLRRIGNISAIWWRRLLINSDHLWSFKFPWRP